MDPRRTASVAEWPIIQNVSQLRSFLGMANYFMEIYPSFMLNVSQSLHASCGRIVLVVGIGLLNVRLPLGILNMLLPQLLSWLNRIDSKPFDVVWL